MIHNNKVYANADDKFVKANILYVLRDENSNNCLYHDLEGTKPVYDVEALELFLSGVLVCLTEETSDGIEYTYYTATSCFEAEPEEEGYGRFRLDNALTLSLPEGTTTNRYRANKLFATANEKFVKSTIVYCDDNGDLFYDPEFTKQFENKTIENLLTEGSVIYKKVENAYILLCEWSFKPDGTIFNILESE